jgi:hypothetical protein
VRGWHLALATVIDGWRNLKRKASTLGDRMVDDLLARETGKVRLGCVDRKGRSQPDRPETFADLVVDARHDFDHFKPKYLPKRWRRLEAEAGTFPRQLHEAFEMFFLTWFHQQQLLREAKSGGG